MRLRTTLAAGTLIGTLAALGGGTPAAAQQVDDSGTFTVTVNGRQVGTEEFTINESGSGSNTEVIATGRADLALATGSLELSSRLRGRGFRADPVSYEVQIGGTSTRRIIGSIGSGRFSARIVTPSGEQLREYVASAGATVLDDGLAHHYYFLARRARSGNVPIIIPRENRQVMATVEDRGEEAVQVGGENVTGFHLVVRPEGGSERHVWVDDLNRVLRVEIPETGYAAVRNERPR